MNFLMEMPDDLKKTLEKENISNIKIYINVDLDINNKFQTVHYVVSNGFLYVINLNSLSISKYEKDKIEKITTEYLLSYGKIYLTYDKQRILIGHFSKKMNKYITLFERYFMKALNNELTEEDYQNNDVVKLQTPLCPKCKTPLSKGRSHSYCKKCASGKNVFLRLGKYIKPYRLKFFWIIILLLLMSLIGVFIPVLTGKILYNEVLAENGHFYGKILVFTIVFLLLKIISTLLNIFYGRILAKTGSEVCLDLKNDIFSSMQKLSVNYFSNKETGNLMNRILWDANQIFYYMVDVLPRFLVNIIQIIGVLVFLFIINPLLAIFVLFPIPLIVLTYYKNNDIFKFHWEQAYLKSSKLNNIINETLEGFRIVKVFSGEEKERRKFDTSSENLANAKIRQMKFVALIYPIFNSFSNILSYIILGLGGYMVIKGIYNFTYGDLMTFVAVLGMVYLPFDFINNFIFSYTPWSINSLRRMYEIIDAVPDIIEKENALDLNIDEVKGNIRFENVSFSYIANEPVLENLNFEIKANSVLGIVGKTGAGKTTLVNLITRLYDPNVGNIYFDGINLKDIKLTSLHQQIALVSQDIYIFKGTIYENIKYAKQDATYEEVIEAAKKANAHDFILNMKNGYDTKVGEGHASLSGGEKQRISIARAILLNSKVIIFDEATASLDTKTEKMIQDSINSLSNGRTLILIAHRLSTLKDADYLIVIEDKKIVESGTMKELIDSGKQFAELYKIQKEGLKFIGVE